MENLSLLPGTRFLYNNEPMLLKANANDYFKVDFQTLSTDPVKFIDFNMHVNKFAKLHRDGEIILPGELVSVQNGRNFTRGKLVEVSADGFSIQSGSDRENSISIADLKVGYKVSFPYCDDIFKGEVSDLRKDDIEFSVKSGVKYHIPRHDMPETVLVNNSNIVSFDFKNDLKGAYRLLPGQKFDYRELPSEIFGLKVKDIARQDIHLLLQGKMTFNVYEMIKSNKDTYSAKFSLFREDGKLRVNVNPRNNSLTLSDVFTEYEKEKLQNGEAVRKSFVPGSGEARESYVKIDHALNKLVFIGVDQFNELKQKSGLDQISTEDIKNLIEKGELVLQDEKEKLTISLDYNNKTLDLTTEFMVQRSESFKASNSQELERSNSFKR